MNIDNHTIKANDDLTLAAQKSVEEAIVKTWHQYGGWNGVESGMVNMVSLLAKAAIKAYEEAKGEKPADTEQ